jgi:hypothetical protein
MRGIQARTQKGEISQIRGMKCGLVEQKCGALLPILNKFEIRNVVDGKFKLLLGHPGIESIFFILKSFCLKIFTSSQQKQCPS